MVRQGVPVAIGRLRPDFIVKLSGAIHVAREGGMTDAGVFSAYRPPAFGIGGFGDKFNSLHSYGLAADMTGIGGPPTPLPPLLHNTLDRGGRPLPFLPVKPPAFNHTPPGPHTQRPTDPPP